VDALRRRGVLRLNYEAVRVVGECGDHTDGALALACAWVPGAGRLRPGGDVVGRDGAGVEDGDWSCLRTLTGHSDDVMACTWAPDGSAMDTAGEDTAARVWGAGGWSCIRTLTGKGLRVGAGGQLPPGHGGGRYGVRVSSEAHEWVGGERSASVF